MTQTILLVRLEPDLATYRTSGLLHAIKQHPGVVSVTDLSAISRETLDGMLEPLEPLEPLEVAKEK